MKKGLGKGLSALVQENIISTIEEINPNDIRIINKDSVFKVSPKNILPSRYQPRKEFDEAYLEELAESIKTYGVIQPLVVSDLGNNTFELIAGERRLRASIIAKIEYVPVIVREYQEKDRLAIALIENIQRADLNALEIAEAYKEMIDRLSLTQEELSHIVGKSRTSVTNTMRLLKLPEMIKKMILNQNISEGHGRVLLSLIPDYKLMETIALKIEEKELSVRQTEDLIYQINNKSNNDGFNKKKKNDINEKIHLIEERLIKNLGLRTKMTGNIDRGSIRLFYHTSEELEVLLQYLLKELS